MSDPDLSRRRPWLAALLALVVSGLGHAYLRRWARAFGWYAVITATLVFAVPDAAVDRVVAGERPPIAEIAPALVAVAASVVDAYVLAVRNNRAYERQSSSVGPTEDASPSEDEETAWNDREPEPSEPEADSTTESVSCPHCGRDTDASLDFCQWCAESLGE
ncbi:zinc ribbon domain-containing protein [Halorubrum sp. CSM-61]|uniref:zinc ribbon domain-containing protein n=1 Tax=Halorubrum sp. CSM-61 TaxID=2485838 RepID=UPI000F4B8368|nr:zinc ribbon domain-containing protein [Halorubrum sp. CSM-61]